MKKVTVYKRNLPDKVKWLVRPNGNGVIHKIEVVDEIRTPDGNMFRAYTRNICDLQNPSTDVAALIGNIFETTSLGNQKPQPAELWFWNNKFWTTALDAPFGQEYYHKKMRAFYEVVIEDSEKLFAAMSL